MLCWFLSEPNVLHLVRTSLAQMLGNTQLHPHTTRAQPLCTVHSYATSAPANHMPTGTHNVSHLLLRLLVHSRGAHRCVGVWGVTRPATWPRRLSITLSPPPAAARCVTHRCLPKTLPSPPAAARCVAQVPAQHTALTSCCCQVRGQGARHSALWGDQARQRGEAKKGPPDVKDHHLRRAKARVAHADVTEHAQASAAHADGRAGERQPGGLPVAAGCAGTVHASSKSSQAFWNAWTSCARTQQINAARHCARQCMHQADKQCVRIILIHVHACNAFKRSMLTGRLIPPSLEISTQSIDTIPCMRKMERMKG